MRLAKYLAHAGIASRRAAEEIIAAGRVSVDGELIRDPARDVDDSHAITVDGTAVRSPDAAAHVVFALHKPAGVVSTAQDTHGRPTVVDLVPSPQRLYPVGRLDADTTGLILLTNDGDLAHRLTHPSFEVEKTYRAVVSGGPVRDRDLEDLRTGVYLEDGLTAPARVERVQQGGRGGPRGSSTLLITIHEGRKRQVKRMCAAVGHPVRSLTRVRFGPLELSGLAPGAYRRLNPAEVSQLAGAGSAPAGSAPRRGAGTDA